MPFVMIGHMKWSSMFLWRRAQCSSRAWRDECRSSSRRAEARDWGEWESYIQSVYPESHHSSMMHNVMEVDCWLSCCFFVFIGCVGVGGSRWSCCVSRWSCCVSRHRGWSRRGGGRDLLHLFRALDHGWWPPLGRSALWSPVWLHLHFPLVVGRRK